MNHSLCKLILVTHKGNTPLDTYLNFISQCAFSGITAVQLREKHLPFKEVLELGQELQIILKPLNIPLVVNDSVKLALALDADGLHLGQTDMDVLLARQYLGQDKMIGISINSSKQLLAANNMPVDYVGIGAIFPTRNKEDVEQVWGCQGLAGLSKYSKKSVVAIDGINLSNIHEVMRAGADGIAAIAAFHTSTKPSDTTKRLINIIREYTA